MLIKTEHNFSIQPIIDQVLSLPEFNRLALNETSGNLLTGKYTIKKEFLNTPLGEVLEVLGDIGEARLLKLKNEEVYTAHCDPDDRWHLTITTTPYAFLVDINNKSLHHLPADGALWFMDTGVVHSAINLGSGERIHLNIRKRLPEYKGNGWRMKFTGNHDWKQKLYIHVLGYINRAIKIGHITGIEKVEENEMLINVIDERLLGVIEQLSQSAGLDILISRDE